MLFHETKNEDAEFVGLKISQSISAIGSFSDRRAFMPTLNWIGKDKVVTHHLDVPYRVLEHRYTYPAPGDCNSTESENRIIRGDNLEALKALLPEYEGRINCIYIDRIVA